MQGIHAAFRSHERWQVTGVGHDDTGPTCELRAWDDHDQKIVMPVIPEVDFRIVSARRCIGHRAPGSAHLVPCDQGDPPLSGSQCARCAERALMIPCLRCTGLRCHNPARRSECVQPGNHAVYLASFGPGVIKVGVARWQRRRERLREQGARAGLIVAREDGQLARRLEHLIAEHGTADRGRGSERHRALSDTTPAPVLLGELRHCADVLRRRFPREAWLGQAQELALSHHGPGAGPAPPIGIGVGETIAGAVDACGGHWISFLRDGERHSCDLAGLVGYGVASHAQLSARGDHAQYQLTLLG